MGKSWTHRVHRDLFTTMHPFWLEGNDAHHSTHHLERATIFFEMEQIHKIMFRDPLNKNIPTPQLLAFAMPFLQTKTFCTGTTQHTS